MIALYLIYCTFLIVFCGFFFLITMASSHQFVSMDNIYLMILGLSSLSFLITIFFILRRLFTQQTVKGKYLKWLVLVNIFFFVYYTYGFLYDNEDVDYISYSPLIGIVLSILVLISFKKKTLSHR